MNKSEQISELAFALSKLQGKITDAVKDTKAYGHMYAELSQMLKIARPLLSEFGLSISQLPYNKEDKVGVETMLMHSSGQFISSSIEMPLIDGKGMNTAQKVGSVISYIRKYAYLSILGFTQQGMDDDAESVEEKPQFPKAHQAPKKEFNKTEEKIEWKMDDIKFNNLLKLLSDAGYTDERVFNRYGIDDLMKLTEEQYNQSCRVCNKAIADKNKDKK